MKLKRSLPTSLLRIFLTAILCYQRCAEGMDRQDIGSRYELFTTEDPLQGDGLPLETIPRIPDGHKQYQFFNLDSKGTLQKQWMSLQEVQNIILAYAYEKHNKIKPSLTHLPPFDAKVIINKTPLITPTYSKTRIETSVEDVLANVQKVMSKEITNSLLRDDFQTPSLPDSYAVTETTDSATTNGFSTTGNIQNTLINDQLNSLNTNHPWGFMSQNANMKLFGKIFQTTPYTNDGTTTEVPAENFLKEDEDGEAPSTIMERTTEAVDYKSDTEGFDQSMLDSLPDLQSKVNSNEYPAYLEYQIFPRTKTRPQNNVMTGYTSNDEFRFANTKSVPSYTMTPVANLDKSDYSEEQLSFLNSLQSTTLSSLDSDVATTEKSHQPTVTTWSTNSLKEIQETENYQTTVSNENAPLNPDFVNNLLDELNKDKPLSDVDGNEKSQEKNAEKINSFVADAAQQFSIYGQKVNEPISSSIVLSPSENAQILPETIAALGYLSGKNDVDYSFYDAPIYLEDIPDQVGDLYGDLQPQKASNDSKNQFDFPKPNVTNSYDKPDHVSPNQHDNPLHIHPKPSKTQIQVSIPDIEAVDPTQFLPAYNPDLIKGENPLQKTPPYNIGLEATTINMDPNVKTYIDAMNNLSFQIYKRTAKIHRRQNVIMAPINLISSLSMLHLGARNTSADALSKLLKLDGLLYFNPHLLLKNITESMIALNSHKHDVGIVNNIFITKSNKEDYSVDFFARTMEFFYNALVEQVPGSKMGQVARDRANDEIRKQTSNVVHNFLKPKASLRVEGPLSVVSSAYFQGDWGLDISERDLIDMNFIRFPSAERRLIKTVGLIKRMDINAGYSEEMDATVAEIPLASTNKEISMVLVMPGQQKSFIANGLSKLEQDLDSNNWSKLIRSVIPHKINFKMPIFSHRNYLNLTAILTDVGLKNLFTESADFSGINGLKNLHVGDIVQLSEFHSCKLDVGSFTKAKTSPKRLRRSTATSGDYFFKKDTTIKDWRNGRQMLKPSKIKVTEEISNFYRNDNTLAYDRAFFYVLRHNPTGLVLFIGRYLDPETF